MQFSRNDHSSTPQANPAKHLARQGVVRARMQLSSSQARAMAAMTVAALTTVRRALRLSKYHRRPARRQRARSAAVPVAKSAPMKSAAQSTSGAAGAKSAPAAAAAPLKSLYEVSIDAAAFQDVAVRVVLRIGVVVRVEIVRGAA